MDTRCCSFLVNGADVVRTVTYQCSVQSLEKHLSIGRSEAIDVLKLAVSTAIEARDEFWKVAIQGICYSFIKVLQERDIYTVYL